jgi:hypothetical protein
MKKIDWEKLFKEYGKEVNKEALDAFKEHKGLFVEITKEELALLLHNISVGDKEELNAIVFKKQIEQMSDDEFLAIRKATVDQASAWVILDRKKKKVVDDLIGRVTKVTANILIKAILLG